MNDNCQHVNTINMLILVTYSSVIWSQWVLLLRVVWDFGMEKQYHIIISAIFKISSERLCEK